MRALPLLLLLVPLLAVAAPVPKVSDEARWKKVLGEVVDPDGDCQFGYGRDTFTITVPDTPHTTERVGLLGKAPRTETKARGVFELVVRVDVTVETKATSARPSPLFARAGLYVRDDSQVMYHSRQHSLEPNADDWRDETFVRLTGRGQQSATTIPHAESAAVPQYLRLVRRDDDFIAYTSTDAKNWVVADKNYSMKGSPNELTVGVFVEHNTGSAVTARFDHFSLDRP
jgi:regulation of enolase protein 1 (concanavalin A-like superfamily)